MALSNLGPVLWTCADSMRGSMSADEYKDYLLGLVFYKHISDSQLYDVYDLLRDEKPESLEQAQKFYEELFANREQSDDNAEEWNELQKELIEKYGFAIAPQTTFTAFYNQINANEFTTDNLRQAMRDIEQKVFDLDDVTQIKPYEDLFEDFDIDSKSLGATPRERNRLLADVIKKLQAVNLNEYGADALGDAYEYLIGQFAAGSGKKAGEFYTPQAVSILITKIVTSGKEAKQGFSIYDPCMGSASLLLQAKNYLDESTRNTVQFFGQERSHTTYNLARMNMILHHVPFTQQHFRNGDTLGADWPTEEPTSYDSVVMNPPYSQGWSADKGFMSDQRFQPYEKLAPKSKADFAFLLHGFYHLKTDGTMGIVLPHGVLFRGAAEGTIRRHLLENGSIYAVIGMPANIFFNTSIPTCVIILKKNLDSRDVLFIDASKEFRAGKKQNFMDVEHIDKIVEAFKERKDIEKFAHLAAFEEIKENDFNLNIPRYVDTSEPEPEVDLAAVSERMENTNKAIKDSTEQLISMMGELTFAKPETKAVMDRFMKVFQEV